MSHSPTYPQINGEQAPASARRWPWLLPVAILLAAVLTLLYWGILRDLGVQWWDDDNYNHGFLIPLFSGFLLWRERHRLRHHLARHDPRVRVYRPISEKIRAGA